MPDSSKSYKIYRTAPFSMTLNDPLTQISRSRHYRMLNVSETDVVCSNSCAEKLQCMQTSVADAVWRRECLYSTH